MKFEKLDKDIIDLYSEEKTITIKENEDSYKLEFNVVSYNQEVLMFVTSVKVFMDCKQDSNKLICQVKKDDLEKSLIEKESKVSIYYLSNTASKNQGLLLFVGDITINDNITQKTDIYVSITKLLENIAEGESHIAYETNVTNINKISVVVTDLTFINEKGEKKVRFAT